MRELHVERYMVIFNGFFINSEFRSHHLLMVAHAHCMFYNFQNAFGRHRITPEILIKMKISFLHLEV